jgi:hypothetical protein
LRAYNAGAVALSLTSTVFVAVPAGSPAGLPYFEIINNSGYTINVDQGGAQLGPLAAGMVNVYPTGSQPGTPVGLSIAPGQPSAPLGTSQLAFVSWWDGEPPGTFPAGANTQSLAAVITPFQSVVASGVVNPLTALGSGVVPFVIPAGTLRLVALWEVSGIFPIGAYGGAQTITLGSTGTIWNDNQTSIPTPTYGALPFPVPCYGDVDTAATWQWLASGAAWPTVATLRYWIVATPQPESSSLPQISLPASTPDVPVSFVASVAGTTPAVPNPALLGAVNHLHGAITVTPPTAGFTLSLVGASGTNYAVVMVPIAAASSPPIAIPVDIYAGEALSVSITNPGGPVRFTMYYRQLPQMPSRTIT